MCNNAGKSEHLGGRELQADPNKVPPHARLNSWVDETT